MLSNAEILQKSTRGISSMYRGRLTENNVYQPLGKLKVNDQFRVSPTTNFFTPDLSFEAQQVIGSMPNLLLTVIEKNASGITVSDATGNKITVPIKDKDAVQVMVLTGAPLQMESSLCRKFHPHVHETMSNLKDGDSFTMDGNKFTLVGKDKSTPDTYTYRDKEGNKKKIHKDDADKKNINKVKESQTTLSNVRYGESFKLTTKLNDSMNSTVYTRCQGNRNDSISYVDKDGKLETCTNLYSKYVNVELVNDNQLENVHSLDRLASGSKFRFMDDTLSMNGGEYIIKEHRMDLIVIESCLDETTRAVFMTQAASLPVMLIGSSYSKMKMPKFNSVDNITEDFRPLSDLKVNTYFMLLSATSDTNQALSMPTKQLLTFVGTRSLMQVMKNSGGSVTVGSAIGFDLVIPSKDATRLRVTPLGMNV